MITVHAASSPSAYQGEAPRAYKRHGTQYMGEYVAHYPLPSDPLMDAKKSVSPTAAILLPSTPTSPLGDEGIACIASDIAIDHLGQQWITEPGANRIRILNEEGVFVRYHEFAVGHGSALRLPITVCCDTERGRVYIGRGRHVILMDPLRYIVLSEFDIPMGITETKMTATAQHVHGSHIESIGVLLPAKRASIRDVSYDRITALVFSDGRSVWRWYDVQAHRDNDTLIARHRQRSQLIELLTQSQAQLALLSNTDNNYTLAEAYRNECQESLQQQERKWRDEDIKHTNIAIPNDAPALIGHATGK
jgi:hypothetical protein